MPRLMSFAKTIEAVEKMQKKVTRREGWKFLEPGDMLKPVKKAPFALKEPPYVRPVLDDYLIKVVEVQRELVGDILDYPELRCPNCNGTGKRQFPVVGGIKHLDCSRCYQTGRLSQESINEGFPKLSHKELIEEVFIGDLGLSFTTEVTRIRFEYGYIGSDNAET